MPSFSPTARRAFLDGLPGRLARALGEAALLEATAPPQDAGIQRELLPDTLWIGPESVPSTMPRIALTLGPPVDARELARSWGITRPVAVSGTVHQTLWELKAAGGELSDPYALRIATEPITSGPWEARFLLTGRPAGPLPNLVAGASPAYDIIERGGAVNRIEVRMSPREARVVQGDDPEAATLVAAMTARAPHWRGGWLVQPNTPFVVLFEEHRPKAGGTLVQRPGGVMNATLYVADGGIQPQTCAVLLVALEAVALRRGASRLRLDESAFLLRSHVPYERHGYVVGPEYDGDADVPTWTERELLRP